MNWIFSFIILLAVCQCSVAKKHKARNGDKNVTTESTMAPLTEKKQPGVEKKEPGVEKKHHHHHHHKEKSHHAKEDKHRFEIEKSHDKEKKKEKERKGKDIKEGKRKEKERKEKERKEDERKEKEIKEGERKEKERKEEERKEKDIKEEKRKEQERKEEERREIERNEEEIKELVRKEEEKVEKEINELKQIEEENQATNQENHVDTYRVRDSSEPAETWKINVDIPEILRTIHNYTGISITDGKIPKSGLRASNDPGIFGQKIRIEMKPEIPKKVLGFLDTLLRSPDAPNLRRAYFPNRWVEEQPGEIKSDTHVYPTEQETGQLYALLELKKRRERQAAQELKRLEEDDILH